MEINWRISTKLIQNSVNKQAFDIPLSGLITIARESSNRSDSNMPQVEIYVGNIHRDISKQELEE